MSQAVADVFLANIELITEGITNHCLTLIDQGGANIPRAQTQAIVRDAMQRMHRDLAAGTTDQYAEIWPRISTGHVQAGLSLEVALDYITRTEDTIIGVLAPYYANDATGMRALFESVYGICQIGRHALFATYTNAREEVIREQSAAISELSAPLIPVHPGVLVLPLIGAVDSLRAASMTEALLEGITARSAQVVLLDITGVPVVDTAVAHHIVQAARAVRLLGAELVLVGIGPEIAQTIVQLGVDLSHITTRSDLQAGFSYALDYLGLAIGRRNALRP